MDAGEGTQTPKPVKLTGPGTVQQSYQVWGAVQYFFQAEQNPNRGACHKYRGV